MGKVRTLEFYPSLIAKVGLAPAIVLSKIFYWNQGRLRIKRKGKLWLAKSRRDMCAETGLSLDQQNRAIHFLKHEGIIIVERGLFQNRVTPFIQLTKRGRQLLEWVKSHQLIGANVPQLIVAKLPQSIDAVSHQSSSTVIHGIKSTAAITALGDGVAEMHSKDVLTALQGKKNIPDDVVVKNATALAVWWQKLVPHYHDMPVLEGGLKMKPLTHKEVGMLAKFMSHAGGPGKAYRVMRWAVQHWHLLAISVKESKGESLPTWPRVNHLLRHYDIAVGCSLKNSQQSGKQPSGVKLVSKKDQKGKLHIWGS